MKIAIAILLLKFGQSVPANEVAIAQVNGFIISRTEIQREMHRYRAAVFNQYHYLPIGVLRKKGLEALIKIKVQEQLLKKNHLWPYRNYAELLKLRINTNTQRAQIVRNHGIVYGPVAYTEEGFFDYQFGNAVIRLKNILKKTNRQYDRELEKLVKVAHYQSITELF